MPDHNNIAAEEQRIVREIQRNRQLREEVERSTERLAGQQAPYITAVQTPTEQRIRERERGRVLRETAVNEEQLRAAVRRRNGVVQTPSGRSYIVDLASYIVDLEGNTVAAYTNRHIENRPVNADFESSYRYNVFLNSKYKHHHKCATCQKVFRCGQAKCDRTLCRICDLSNELNAQTVIAQWSTGEAVRVNFNATEGAAWGVDYAAVERQLRNESIATAIEEVIEI